MYFFSIIEPYILTLRPKHWVKNIFIFAPLFFAMRINETDAVFKTALAFLLFSLLCGSVYTLNDVIDIKTDKLNKLKKNRPVASGLITKKKAVVFALLLSSAVLSFSYTWNTGLFSLMALYMVLNIFYTLKIKEIVIVDVFFIAFGFIIRLYIGSCVVDQPLSHWIISSTFLLALFLGFAKRRSEIINLSDVKDGRVVLEKYSVRFIDNITGVTAALCIINYIFYCVSPEVTERFGTDMIAVTSIFVIYGFFRYFYLIHHDDVTESPADVLYTDIPSIVNIILWASVFFMSVRSGI